MLRKCALLACLTLAACLRPPEHTQAKDGGPAATASTSTATSPQVIIVGGGLAGLSAALTLDEAGVSYRLFEASDALGGRVQTAYYGEGLDAEYGMQEIWQGNPLLDIARKLGVDLDGEPEPPYSSVLIDGKLHPYVQDTVEAYFSSFLTPAERAALAAWMKRSKALHDTAKKEGLASAEVRPLQDVSFAAWLASAKLPHKVSEWIRLTLECELATSADQFSALFGLLEFGIFFGGDVPNFHVKGGNSRLIAAMAAHLRSPVLRSAPVTALTRTTTRDGRPRVRATYMQNNHVETLEAERAIVAVPFTRVHQIAFDPPLAEERTRAIQGLGFGQYVVVHFLISREARPLFSVEGTPVTPVLSDGPLGVVYGVQHEPAASEPLDVFALLVYGTPARLFHMAPRDLKIAEETAALEELWPGFEKWVKSGHVYSYHPAAIPVWPPGRSPIDALSEAVRQPDRGVYFAGDWTLGAHSDAAVRSGIAAAKAAAAELGR